MFVLLQDGKSFLVHYWSTKNGGVFKKNKFVKMFSMFIVSFLFELY